MPAKIISIVNLKGGVGKTTISSVIAESIASEDKWVRVGGKFSNLPRKKVLMIDLDGQANLTFASISQERIEETWRNNKTIYHYFDGINNNKAVSLAECVVKNATNISPFKGTIDLIPSVFDLFKYEEELLEFANSNHHVSISFQRNILRVGLEDLKLNYDFIIIDCPPNLSILTTNALVASDTYIVPVVPERLSLYGLELIKKRVQELKENANLYPSIEKLRFIGCVLNRVDTRRNDHLHESEKILKNPDYQAFENWIGDWKPMYVSTDFNAGIWRTFNQKYKGKKQRPTRSQILYHSGSGVTNNFIDVNHRLDNLAAEVRKRVE